LLKGRKLLGIRVWLIFHEHGGHIREVWAQIVSQLQIDSRARGVMLICVAADPRRLQAIVFLQGFQERAMPPLETQAALFALRVELREMQLNFEIRDLPTHIPRPANLVGDQVLGAAPIFPRAKNGRQCGFAIGSEGRPARLPEAWSWLR